MKCKHHNDLTVESCPKCVVPRLVTSNCRAYGVVFINGSPSHLLLCEDDRPKELPLPRSKNVEVVAIDQCSVDVVAILMGRDERLIATSDERRATDRDERRATSD